MLGNHLLLYLLLRSRFGPSGLRLGAPRLASRSLSSLVLLHFRYNVLFDNHLLLHLLKRPVLSLASLACGSALRASDSALRASILAPLARFFALQVPCIVSQSSVTSLASTSGTLARFARSRFGPSGLKLGAPRLAFCSLRSLVLLHWYQVLLGNHLLLHLLLRPVFSLASLARGSAHRASGSALRASIFARFARLFSFTLG